MSGNDLLAAWAEDPAVSAAALYLESFHDPRKFARVAAVFARQKPLLVAFGGTSSAGLRAGASHTAASATPARALQALFRTAGVVAVDGVEDLVDTAALLTEQPLPRGPRLGVLGNAGGLGILAADAAQRVGLRLPELSPQTRRGAGHGRARRCLDDQPGGPRRRGRSRVLPRRAGRAGVVRGRGRGAGADSRDGRHRSREGGRGRRCGRRRGRRTRPVGGRRWRSLRRGGHGHRLPLGRGGDPRSGASMHLRGVASTEHRRRLGRRKAPWSRISTVPRPHHHPEARQRMRDGWPRPTRQHCSGRSVLGCRR